MSEDDLQHWLFSCIENEEAPTYLISEMTKLNALPIKNFVQFLSSMQTTSA